MSAGVKRTGGAGDRSAQAIWLLDLRAECSRRADPSQNHAGDPDGTGGVRGPDDRALGGGESAAAATGR